MKPIPTHDVIVVGSGAAGGWVAKELTQRGASVLLLDAGPTEMTNAGTLTYEQARARQPVQSRCYAYDERTRPFFVDDIDNPYVTPRGRPFQWIRSRTVGGRMRLWARYCLRMSDLDFHAARHDGQGEDWPIGYADLAPYYDRVERFLQVTGTAEGLPLLPDGRLAERLDLTPTERRLRNVLSQKWPDRRLVAPRMALRGHEHVLQAAASTGRLTLRANAVVGHVLLDRSQKKATGVAFVDRLTHAEVEARSRAVVLCASTIESTRILLDSKSARHSSGLANSSGVLGHYLMDHTSGIELLGIDPHTRPEGEEQALRFMTCSHIPRFRNLVDRHPRFRRGYGCYVSVPREAHAVQSDALKRLLSAARAEDRTPFNMWCFGEVLPRFENQVTLAPETRDAWGNPAVRIDCTYSENEMAMADDAAHSLAEMAQAAGFSIMDRSTALRPPGTSIHELGTARMGLDPRTSVLNPFNQSWDIPNLFVTDGSCFVSGGCQNPTLTIMALSARAAEYLATHIQGF